MFDAFYEFELNFRYAFIHHEALEKHEGEFQFMREKGIFPIGSKKKLE